MKKYFVVFHVILIFWNLPLLYGMIDMDNGNYSNTMIDIQIPGAGFDLSVRRTYNSQTLFEGIFGYGFCSDYETKINITAEGNLTLQECGAGRLITFYPREFDTNQIKNTITEIISRLKTNKAFNANNLNLLSEQMLENHDLRTKYANELKIRIPVKDGSKFFVNGKEVENITLSKKQYLRTLSDGSVQVFNISGMLTQFNDRKGNFIKLQYESNNVLSTVTDNQGRKLTFKYNQNKKVKSISAPQGIIVEYKYANLDDLVYVKNQWRNEYTYQYDDAHNMIRSNYPDKTFIALTYDIKNDWVTSFKDREGCLENYKYEFSEDEPKFHYWSTVKKTCNQKVVNESRHEFWYKKREDGQVALRRTASTINGNLTDVTYHDIFGKPISIIRNSLKYDFEYLPNGLVKTKSTKFTKMNFEYDPSSNKIIKVNTDLYKEDGKKGSSRWSEFRYDKSANLILASNSDGQRVEMTYDLQSRITKIKDHTKKVVIVSYNEQLGKPSVITRPGLGTLKISYKANGEIDKTDSKEGPSVAMQIASTFNNLLEVMAPATGEMYQ